MDHTTTATELAALTASVAAGQAAETRRAALIRTARREDPEYWTQSRLAEAAGISQAAVSKVLAKETSPVLDSTAPGHLIGRITGVGGWVSLRLEWRAECTSLTDKIIEGRMPPTEAVLTQLRDLIGKDLAALAGPDRRLVKNALAEIDRLAGGPLGSARLTQREQVQALLAEASQKQHLIEASA